MVRSKAVLAAVLGVALACPAAADAQPRDGKPQPPYFASIGAGKARMRSGPGRTYPATWLYVRADLPVKVVGLFKEWRKIEDPDGAQGWMQGSLIRSTRTAIVRGGIAELRERPVAGAKVLWRAEPGVVGRLSQCGRGWCRLDVRGQAGFVEVSHLWGVSPDEVLP